MDSSTSTICTGPLLIEGVSGKFLSLPCFIRKIPVLNVNGVDPDQAPRSAASYLGLHCFPLSLLWDIRHKWVK